MDEPDVLVNGKERRRDDLHVLGGWLPQRKARAALIAGDPRHGPRAGKRAVALEAHDDLVYRQVGESVTGGLSGR
jgi:hypothetical protein